MPWPWEQGKSGLLRASKKSMLPLGPPGPGRVAHQRSRDGRCLQRGRHSGISSQDDYQQTREEKVVTDCGIEGTRMVVRPLKVLASAIIKCIKMSLNPTLNISVCCKKFEIIFIIVFEMNFIFAIYLLAP